MVDDSRLGDLVSTVRGWMLRMSRGDLEMERRDVFHGPVEDIRAYRRVVRMHERG